MSKARTANSSFGMREIKIRTGGTSKGSNPFTIPEVVELFGTRDNEKMRIEEERDTIRSMTLAQRAEMTRPGLNSQLGSAQRSTQQTARSISVMSTGSTQKSARRQRTSEFIQQKREIFLIQMLIDRKNKEIKKINKKIQFEEANIIETHHNLDQTAVEYKITTAQIEQNLAKARKAIEAATRQRVELNKQSKMKVQSVAIMKSEISKNEELLENFHRYYDFLESLVPDKYTMFTYFSSPDKLIEEFTKIEKENLELYNVCHHYQGLLDQSLGAIEKELNITEEHTQKEKNNLINVIKKQQELIDRESPSPEEVDQELLNFGKMIRSTYVKCFGKDSNVSSLTMLEKIENEMEMKFQKLEVISPQFIQEKQAIRDKERREEQRKAKQEKQAAEQKLKMEQAIERANKPINKKTGRPLYQRTIPIKVVRNDDARILALRREQQRQEKLLYGPVWEE